MPFDCLISIYELFVPSHSLVSNEWNFMKLILNIYNYSVVMHINFHQGAVMYREIIALFCLNIIVFSKMETIQN